MARIMDEAVGPARQIMSLLSLLAGLALVLSAIGVYLGRFPRFNSWDVLTNPHGLVAVVVHRLADPLGNPFLLRFGVLMSVVLLGSYAVVWILGRGILGPRTAPMLEK